MRGCVMWRDRTTEPSRGRLLRVVDLKTPTSHVGCSLETSPGGSYCEKTVWFPGLFLHGTPPPRARTALFVFLLGLLA